MIFVAAKAPLERIDLAPKAPNTFRAKGAAAPPCDSDLAREAPPRN